MIGYRKTELETFVRDLPIDESERNRILDEIDASATPDGLLDEVNVEDALGNPAWADEFRSGHNPV